jgi:sigma-B regulation protein RsbU (phosphoserine phosphatase)
MIPAATATRDLIPELCGHFGQISGWELQFTPARRSPAEVRKELEDRADCCWLAGVGDVNRPAGFLHLVSPGTDDFANTEPPRCDFVKATALAEVLAHTLGRLVQSTTQLNQRNQDVATLLELGLAVPGQDDLAFGLTQLLKAAAHLTGSWSAAFFLLDPQTERLKLRAVFRLSREDVPQPQRELRTGTDDLRALADQPVILTAGSSGGHPLFPPAMRAAMCAGVQSETVPFGTLWVYDRRNKQYTQRDMHVLQSIAAQVAAMLERSALLRGSEMDDRVNRDLKAASETQPDSILRDLPHDPRFELAARCTSCYELGGDLCEVVPLTPDRVLIAVGDASGNSIPAAMIMSAVRGAIRAHGGEGTEVVEMVSRLNRALCSLTGSHQFMSLCFGIFDAASRTYTYCNAGHPVPLHVTSGIVEPLESHGLLLGVIPEAGYQSSVVQLTPGDLLVLYSDGITEARSAAQQLFKWEGISATVLESPRRSAEEVLETVWNRVDEHMQGGEDGDDRTLVVLRVP